MSDPRSRRARLRRRAVSVPGLVVAALVLTIAVPVWLPMSLVVDAARLRFRFPIARLLAFAVCWCWIEVAGVARLASLWARRRAGDQQAHYDLMGWWSHHLVTALGMTTGLRPRIEGIEALISGDALVLARHASLGDSLLSAWALAGQAAVRPRYVLKKELLWDPCLDVVGLRVPNHFLDRSATDGAAELDAVRALAAGVGPGVVVVIFPEGTRANPDKRTRALARIEASDRARAGRLGGLRHLLPPRPAGTVALASGAPHADIVLAWHVGFDGLDTFAGMIDALVAPPPPVRFVARRVSRADVPDGAGFADWLDEQWLRMDAEVAAAIA